MPADPDCLFCKIVAGELPSTRVDEDERTVAFMDINPATRGHALVVPRAHHRDLLELPADDLAATVAAVVAAGGEVVQEARDVGGGRLVGTVRDADGNVVGVLQDPSGE